jgi:SHS2 domain-containing protein
VTIVNEPFSGFREIEHTADWEVEAWAGDLPGLFEQAARGMYALSGTRLAPGPRQRVSLEIQAGDVEGILVNFLSELLFLAEQKGLGIDSYDLTLQRDHLIARLDGAPIAAFDKEIKAVTFHRMNIRRTEAGFRVNVVFDV